MRKLPKYVSHAGLVQEIVGQFVFMKLMADFEEHNFMQLMELDLNDVLKKADDYFVNLCDNEGLIDTKTCGLETYINQFLQPWKIIVDITAIQQNVHYKLYLFDYAENSK